MPATETFHSSIHAALLLLVRELVNWPEAPTTEEILELNQLGAKPGLRYDGSPAWASGHSGR